MSYKIKFLISKRWLLIINLTSLSNLLGSKEFLLVPKQSPEMLKVLSQELWVAGIDNKWHAICESNWNLLIIIWFVQNLKTFSFALFSLEKLPKYEICILKSVLNCFFKYLRYEFTSSSILLSSFNSSGYSSAFNIIL